MASPPLAPAAAAAPLSPTMAAGVTGLEQIAKDLRQSGEAGRRICIAGAERNVGTTFAAISLGRLLAESASAVLVDLALAAPNIPVISTDPNAPGIAEVIGGSASFGDIITRDQHSQLHLVAAGNAANAGAILASPMLATIVEALARSYEHVLIDIGAASEIDLGRFVALVPRAVLVTADPAGAATRAAREHMAAAGFAEVVLALGGPQAVAA
jgi:MinD-like ATPase involved in chromosome partitioning or flagellar assembly